MLQRHSIHVAGEGYADVSLCNALRWVSRLRFPFNLLLSIKNNPFYPLEIIQNNGITLAFIILNVNLFAIYLVRAFRNLN